MQGSPRDRPAEMLVSLLARMDGTDPTGWYLSPVLQNCQSQDGSYHGYGIQHFLAVDPRFASDKRDPDGELRHLVDEEHARGIHVIMDIVLNHAGDVFAYHLDDGSE